MTQLSQHAGNVPANDNRQRRKQRQNIRYQLSLADGEKDKDEHPPDVEKQQAAHIINAAVLNRSLNCLRQHADPGEQSQNQHRDIVPKGYAVSVLRRSKARNIVKAQEGINEFHAMHRVHRIIPRRSDKQIQQKATDYMHAQNLTQLPHHQQI